MLLSRPLEEVMRTPQFQWAPTLGGECYQLQAVHFVAAYLTKFQWAPTLGGECYQYARSGRYADGIGFNGHPPLGVNATGVCGARAANARNSFNGHPPLGVNATASNRSRETATHPVSMGTHPWG